MSKDRPTAGNLTGSLLVAHPSLHDPNFRRTILFLSHHSSEEGAVGLVLNRPLRKTLGTLSATKIPAPLKKAPTFYGGPVAVDQVTVASLQWRDDPESVTFHSYMGELGEVLVEPEWRPGLRVFLGYAGWTQGQLEAEIAQKAWLIVPPTRALIEMADPDEAWKEIMRHSGPVLRLLAEAPDHPELN